MLVRADVCLPCARGELKLVVSLADTAIIASVYPALVAEQLLVVTSMSVFVPLG